MAQSPRKSRNPTQAELEYYTGEIVHCMGDPSIDNPGDPVAGFLHFVDKYCSILASSDLGDWVKFDLWPAQKDGAAGLALHRLVCVLKARQLGWTWLAIAYALWLTLFRPIQTVLLFSLRDDEAISLLRVRFLGMYNRLPSWLRDNLPIVKENDHELELSNGSRVMAFPTTGGRSYTATLAIVDEADFIPDLQALLAAVKPTIDAGGRLVLLSSADKGNPESLFKRIYRLAVQGSQYHPIFHGWRARPDRTQQWYDDEKASILAQTGSLDLLNQEYPETDLEALSPRSLDKRLPPQWLQACFAPSPVLRGDDLPDVPGLTVYQRPQAGRTYVVGGDPAEGNPTSDESAAVFLDKETGEEVAILAGRFEVATFALNVNRVGLWYNQCSALIELNNHGHAVILWLRENGKLRLIKGLDSQAGKGRAGQRIAYPYGWRTTAKSKAILYDLAATAMRDGDCVIHGLETYTQLASIEGGTLRAPEGLHDDRAVAFVLALAGRDIVTRRGADVHGMLDAWQAGRPLAETTAIEELPCSPAGAVQWVPSYEEYHVYVTVNSVRVYLYHSADREDALTAAHLAGLPCEPCDLDPDRRQAIADAVHAKLALTQLPSP